MEGAEESLLPPSQVCKERSGEIIKNPLQHVVGCVNDSTQQPIHHVRPHHNHHPHLPSTMRHNSDGTVSIFTPNASGNSELYTEIPFVAFHGMQTRERDECGVLSGYLDNFQKVLEDVTGIHDDDRRNKQQQPQVTLALVIATIVIASLQFLVGYNVVVLNNPEKYVFPGHRTIYWSMAVAALPIGAPFGASIGGTIVAQQGRWKALIVNIVVFWSGGILQTLAPSLVILTVARFIMGIASGVATVLVPIYLGELAPPNLRGTIGTVNQFAYVVGILFADVFSLQFATQDGWRILFSVTMVVSSMQLILAYFVVESPRWLLQKDPHDPRAKYTLQKLRGHHDQETLENELKTFQQASQTQQGLENDSFTHVLKNMLSRSQDRYLFVCILLLHTAKQLSGVNAVFYYSTSLFEGVIQDPRIITTFIGCVNVLFTYVALLLMDSCRRKSLLLWSIGGMLCANVTLTLSQVGVFGSMVSLVAVNVYVAFFEIGIGPIPWLIIAEMFQAKYVTVMMILCTQLGWIVNFMVSLVFPSVHRVLGDYTFVPFACFLAISFCFIWFALPETQGRTPAQVLVDVKWKAEYADKLSVQELGGGCAGGEWGEKVFD